MTSYEQKFKEFEKMVDSTPTYGTTPTTASFVKTVGFGASPSPSTSASVPETNGSVPIPNSNKNPPSKQTKQSPGQTSAPQTTMNEELKAYKSQIPGWSDSGELSISPKSAEQAKLLSKSLEKSKQDIVPAKKPEERKRAPSNADSSQPGDLSKMTKEERAAYYQQLQAANPVAKREPRPQKVQQQQPNKNPGDPTTQSVSPGFTENKPPKPTKQPQQVRTVLQFDDSKKRAKADKKRILQLTPSKKIIPLFSHLPQYERVISVTTHVGFSSSVEIHPAILKLGLSYSQGAITGANARCVAMLTAFRKVIDDYHDVNGVLFKDFHIAPLVQFLEDCRPKSISMGNAINYLKICIGATKTMSSFADAKEYVISKIDTFVQDRIVAADDLIVKHGVSKINNHDTILTYASSHVVELIFKKAHDDGKKFRLIIVDSRPQREGKELLRRLVKYGVKCTYVALNAVSYMMREVKKVFVGAFTMMSNGNLISRVGTALIAMVAKAYNVPFIVCCETYKFTERVQLESISFNELGDPDKVRVSESESSKDELKNWKDTDNLKLLNLKYDLTPSEFIMMVITEVGMVPPSSVPVILREYSTNPTD